MPRTTDPEIKELIDAVNAGTFSAGKEVGYQQVCDHFPAIARKCGRSSQYRDNFIAWWCKYKKKLNAYKRLEPLPPPAAAKDPDPPVLPDPICPTRRPYPETEVPDKERPKHYKPPKKRVKNHPIPEPAPSPEPQVPEEEEPQFFFPDSLWNVAPAADSTPAAKPAARTPTKPTAPVVKPTPAAKPAARTPTTPAARTPAKPTTPAARTPVKPTTPVAKPTPAAKPPASAKPISPAIKSPPKTQRAPPVSSVHTTLVTKRPPRSPIMDTLTPEEKAFQLIAEQTVIPDHIDLDGEGGYGVEWYKVPWPDANGTMHVTYMVKGATKASIQAGGEVIHVTFPRGAVSEQVVQEIERRFADKLTNPNIRKSFDCFVAMFRKKLEMQAFRRTVSFIDVICLLIVRILTFLHSCLDHWSD